MSFELPYAKPSLKSGDDIFEVCGPMVYTATIQSSKSGTYEAAFKITMDSETKFTSGTVEVRTDDQDFAIDKSKYETPYHIATGFIQPIICKKQALLTILHYRNEVLTVSCCQRFQGKSYRQF